MDFVIERRSYDDADVVRLVADVQQEYVRRYGGPDRAAVEPGEFTDPNGRFLVGLLDGAAAVTGGWRFVADGVAEIKRMYVIDAARRRGLARRMLTALEQSAVRAGAQRVVLNTGLAQPEAIALYESAGYEQIPGFGHYACSPGAVFYGKQVSGAYPPRSVRTAS